MPISLPTATLHINLCLCLKKTFFMNRQISYFIILVLGLNIIGAVLLLQSVKKSKQALEQQVQSQQLQINKLQIDRQQLMDSVMIKSVADNLGDDGSFFPYAQTIWFKNNMFDVYIVDTKTCNIELFLQDPAGAPLLSFDRLGNFCLLVRKK